MAYIDEEEHADAWEEKLVEVESVIWHPEKDIEHNKMLHIGTKSLETVCVYIRRDNSNSSVDIVIVQWQRKGKYQGQNELVKGE